MIEAQEQGRVEPRQARHASFSSIEREYRARPFGGARALCIIWDEAGGQSSKPEPAVACRFRPSTAICCEGSFAVLFDAPYLRLKPYSGELEQAEPCRDGSC